MKIKIIEDEWYPVYEIMEEKTSPRYYSIINKDKEIDISDNLYKRYKKNMEEFNKIQEELEKIRDDNRSNKKISNT